jgi:hypothetical protein
MRKKYFISESLSEPLWCDFAVSKEDAEDIAHYLRRDAEIPEDCDDRYFTHPASFYC